MKHYFLIFFYFIIISCLYAQPSTPQLKEYSLKTWTTDNGLPSNNLRRVFQDGKGYIWLTSFNGLIRFDGHSFDIYSTDELPNLKSNGFKSIAEDKFGTLYFGTQTSGLYNYNGFLFNQSSIENSFSKSITTIFSDSKDRIWVGALDQGVYTLEKDSIKYRKVNSELLNEKTINCILELKNGNIWFATNSHGIVSYDGRSYTKIPANFPKEAQIRYVAEQDDKQYIGTNKGVYFRDNNTWRVLRGTEGFYINYLAFDNNGYLWIATETGLVRVQPSGTVDYLGEEDGLPSRQISSLVIDNENNVWLATKRSGLILLRKSNFKNISTKTGLSSPFVNTVYQMSDGSMLIGNDNGTLDVMQYSKISPSPINTDLHNISIKDILQDRKGNLWLATYKGVLQIKDKNEQLLTRKDGMASLNTRCLFEDSFGNIWVGAKDGGLVRIKPDGTKKIYNKASGMSDEYVFCIDQLPNGSIIAGTYQGGINMISVDDEITIKSISPDGSSPLIFNLEIENNEEYWLATNVGLFKYQDENFIKIGKENGLKVETIFDVYLDDLGYLWLSSNLGVIRVNKNSVKAYIDGAREKVTSRLYDERDGMLSRECTGATKFFVTEDGQLWIPTSKGVSIIDSENIHTNDRIPPIYIKEVKIDDIPIKGDISEITLGPDARKLTIDYTALSYSSSDKISFQYRLVGYDKVWNDMGNQYRATYMNLPDGKFTFEVKASNSDGIWNENPATLKVLVKPFFFKSRIFLLGIAVFLAIIAFVIYWIRIKIVEDKNRELSKLNKELDSFVYSVSHDLRAPLASILGLINVSKLDKETANVPVYMNKIESSVNKLDGFIKDIISYSRNVRLNVEVEEVDLKLLVEETLEGLVYMNPRKAIEVTLETSTNTIIRSDKTRLQIIFNNLISNSFRYYKDYINDPFISIKIRVLESKAQVIIEDNGIGIKPDRINKIFDMFYRATSASNGSGLGLYIAKESIIKLEGTISVESEFERGTKFMLNIPSL